MVGAILALILVGNLRFGMGLINIQGQVQNIVIGLLLIISILVPQFGRQLSLSRSWNRSTIRKTAVALTVAILFGLFFFWSRALILTQ